MNPQTQNVRSNVPMGVLWKWTSVSAVLHLFAIGSLCVVSYFGMQRKDAAVKAKTAAQEAAAQAAEAKEKEEAARPQGGTTGTSAAPVDAKAASNPALPSPSPQNAAPTTDTAQGTVKPQVPVEAGPINAERVLGIDKVAKPEDVPKSPFSSKGDDLLKDLK
jgi:hypothetical protein